MRGFFILLVMTSLLFSQNRVRISVGADWFPYNYLEDSTIVGMDIEIAQKIIGKTNRRLTTEEIPWVRGLLYIEDGMVDLMVAASKTQERSEYAYFSVPYREEVIAIMFRKGESSKYPLDSLSDVKRYRIVLGIERDGWYGEELELLKSDPDMESYIQMNTSLEHRLKMMGIRRYDCVVDDKYALLATAEKMGISDSVELHPYHLVDDSVHFMFSRKSIDSTYVEEVSEQILQYQKSGEMQKIIDSYFK